MGRKLLTLSHDEDVVVVGSLVALTAISFTAIALIFSATL